MMSTIALTLALFAAPTPGEDCGEQACIYAVDGDEELEDAGDWQPDKRLSKKQRRAEAKRYRKAKDVTLRVLVEGGRGTVFVDGRYLAGTGAHAERELDPGKHEIEIRDGEDTVVGVLVIPRKATALTLVVHLDR